MKQAFLKFLLSIGILRVKSEEPAPKPAPKTSTAKRVARGSGIAAAVMAMAIPVVTVWEGIRLEPYRDVVGVLTWCIGETRGEPQDKYSVSECESLLEARLHTDYYIPLTKCIPTLQDAPVPVQAALTSWTYNVGVGAACGSTLARYARAGEWRSACNELPKWNRAGGRVWQGLVNRRADERALCLTGVN